MGFLDRFKKKPADTTRRSRVNIEQRFEIKRTAISGSMSKFFMARDRENDKTIGLKVADSEKTKLFESRFKELKKPSEGEIAISIDHTVQARLDRPAGSSFSGQTDVSVGPVISRRLWGHNLFLVAGDVIIGDRPVLGWAHSNRT